MDPRKNSAVLTKLFHFLQKNPRDFEKFSQQPKQWIYELQTSGKIDLNLSLDEINNLSIAFSSSSWNDLTGSTTTTFTFATPTTITGNPEPTTFTFATPTTITGKFPSQEIQLGDGVTVPIPVLPDDIAVSAPDLQSISNLMSRNPEIIPMLNKAAHDSSYSALLGRVAKAHISKAEISDFMSENPEIASMLDKASRDPLYSQMLKKITKNYFHKG